jgi:copper transport protein
VDSIGNGIVILAPSGRPVQSIGNPTFDETRTTMQVRLQPSAERGTYVVRYAVIGSDGHIVSGRLTFAVGSPSQPQQGFALDVDMSLLLQAVARLLHLLGLTLVFGSAVLAFVSAGLAPARSMQRVTQGTARTGGQFVLVAVLSMFGALLLTTGSTRPLAELRAVAASRTGMLWIVSGIAALAILVGSSGALPRRAREVFWWSAAGTLALVRALGGHAATAPVPAVSIALAAIHTGSATALLGSLLLLPRILHVTQRDTDRTLAATDQLLRRWFLFALVTVDPLLLSGAYTLWVNVESPRALGTTWYGRVLLVKLAVVALLAVPAILSVRAWFRGHQLPWSRLRHGLFPAIVTLLIAGALPLLAPARSSFPVMPEVAGLTLAQNAGPYLVKLTVAPARAGRNELIATVQSPSGRPVDDATLTLAVQNADSQRLVELERHSSTYRTTLALTAAEWDLFVYVQRPGETVAPPAHFTVPIPIPDGRALLSAVDDAMNALRSVEERTSLTSGGPVVETLVQYRAPDRAAYTVTTPDRPRTETIIIDTVRYDRSGSDPWTSRPWPGSQPFRWPAYRYAATAEDVRILGLETVEGVPCYVLAFHDAASDTYYRLWVGVSDLRIRRYVMMATGHYMVGSFARFDDPSIVIAPPLQAQSAPDS